MVRSEGFRPDNVPIFHTGRHLLKLKYNAGSVRRTDTRNGRYLKNNRFLLRAGNNVCHPEGDRSGGCSGDQ